MPRYVYNGPIMSFNVCIASNWKLLKSLSTVEYTITYTHGYCQTRLGDCVRLNYKAAGLTDVKAKVISQSITCESGCPVEETAKYTKNLWR